jgi:hypothetical protein
MSYNTSPPPISYRAKYNNISSLVCDAIRLTDVSITAGQYTAASASYQFQQNDVGKVCCIQGAGLVRTVAQSLNSTIASVSGGVATLNAPAITTVSGAKCAFGTNDTAALQALVNGITASGGGTIQLEAMSMITASIICKNYVSFKGLGKYAGAGLIWGSSSPMVNGLLYCAFLSSNPLIEAECSDLELDGTYGNYGTTYVIPAKGISWPFNVNCTVRNCYIHDFPATGCALDYGVNAQQCFNHFSNNGRQQQDNGYTLPGCAQIGNGTGTYSGMLAYESYQIHHNFCENLNGVGIFVELQSSAGTPLTAGGSADISHNVMNVGVINSNNAAIMDSGSCYTKIHHNTLNGPTSGGTGYSGIRVGNSYLQNSGGIRGECSNNIITGFYYGITGNWTSNTATGNYPIDYTFAHNQCYSQGLNGYFFIGSSNQAVSGLRVLNNLAEGAQDSGFAWSNTGTATSPIFINAIITGNVAKNNAQTTSSSSTKAGFNFRGGVFLVLNFNGNVAYDDQATQTQSYCMSVAAAANLSSGRAIDNDFSSYKTAGVYLVSGGSLPGIMINNKGYNPVGVSSVTPGASPWTYTNGSSPSTLMLGSFVGITSVTIGGVSVPVNSSTGGNFPLTPGQAAVVTYGTVGTASVAVQ